jgi:hypothetical protein
MKKIKGFLQLVHYAQLDTTGHDEAVNWHSFLPFFLSLCGASALRRPGLPHS